MDETDGTMPPLLDSGRMPGGQAALPAGSLSKPFFGPQGDEQRTPATASPSPVTPAPVVEAQIGADGRVGMQPVAVLSDLPDGSITRKTVGETDIVLVRIGQEVQAFAADCPHAGAPLEGGAVCNGRLICPWHKAEFQVSDGSLLEPPALDNLIRYPVRLDGDSVMVCLELVDNQPPARLMSDKTIAVIGSGAAGTAAVVELRRIGFGGRLLLIGPEAQAPYDRTALSKFVLSGEMPPDEVPPLREADYWASQDIERVTAAVSRLDAAAKQVHLEDGATIAYDFALIATGATAKLPDMPGIGLPGVHTLRDARDARAIETAARPGTQVVIIGSSFIGLEAASALRKRGVGVTVVAPDTVPFAKQFGEAIGAMFRRLHEANGVTFRLGSRVEAIEGADHAQAVILKGGERLPADLVLLGVGVAPATDFVAGVETAPDGGIIVDASLRAADGLYVAGDCATFPWHGDHVRIEHWRLAQQHGRVAATAMLGGNAAYDGVPFFWTYHYGQNVEYLGHATEWDALLIVGDIDARDFVALQVKDGHVHGVIACQRERMTAMLIDRMRTALPIDEALDLIRTP